MWRSGLGRKDRLVEKDPELVTHQHGSPCSDREDSRSSLPPPDGRRGTQQGAREPPPGRPRPGGPRLPLPAHLLTPSGLRGQTVGREVMLGHVVKSRQPDGTCRVSLPMRSLTPPPLSDGGVLSWARGRSARYAGQHLPTRPVSSVQSSAGGWSGRRLPSGLQLAL